MSEFRPCAVIPTHNHVAALEAILLRLEAAGLAAIVIDDGSDAMVGRNIAACCAGRAAAEYRRNAENRGKGFAVTSGIARAGERGFTHALQIDADGQHDLGSLDALLDTARRNPAAIVCGVPDFTEPIPVARRIGRPITGFWVAINSLSLSMPDAMCGFRVYPVPATLALVRRSVRGQRMDFDIEILVKAHWAGIALMPVPVRVSYPRENFSNFDLLRDNARLASLQTRLFFGMVLRAPRLLLRGFAKAATANVRVSRWAQMKERGSMWGIRLLAGTYRLLGRRVCIAAMSPVVLYFFVTGREQRNASRDYLAHLWRSGGLSKQPTLWTSFRHFLSFGEAALDRFAAWLGNVPRASLTGASLALLETVKASKCGAFVLTAHIGSPEVVRAIASLSDSVVMNVLMHTAHAQMFNRLIASASPRARVRALAVTEIGIDTAVMLAEAVARGEWVVMAADRSPVAEDGRVVAVPFLGESANFPQGPYILASLLKAPTFLLFCVRDKHRFRLHFSSFAERIELPRANRAGAIRHYATAFACALEKQVRDSPLQWFNFYPFWESARACPAPAQSMRAAAE